MTQTGSNPFNLLKDDTSEGGDPFATASASGGASNPFDLMKQGGGSNPFKAQNAPSLRPADAPPPAIAPGGDHDYLSDPEFTQLAQIRGSYKRLQADPIGASLAQRDDRKLTESLTRRYELTEPELAGQLTLLNQQASQPTPVAAPQADPFATNFAAQTQAQETQADPEFQTAVNESPTSQMVAEKFAGVARFGANTLEPLQYVQDVAGTVYKADISNLDKPVGQQLGAVWDAVKGMEHGKYFDSLNPIKFWSGDTKLAARDYSGEENLRLTARAFKLEDEVPDSAYKVGGILADVFVDPLVLGGAIRSVGRVAKLGEAAASRGARTAAELGRVGGGELGREAISVGSRSNRLTRAAAKGGDKLIELGDKVEAMLSPAGVVKGLGKPIPKSVKNAIGERLDTVFERVMNFELTNKEYGVGKETPVSVARFVTGDGAMPWNRDRDFLSGQVTHDEWRAAQAEGAIKPTMSINQRTQALKDWSGRPVNGTKTPDILRDSVARAEFVADKGVDALQRGMARLYSTLGNDAGKKYIAGLGDHLSKMHRVMENPKFQRYEGDTEMMDTLMAMSLDTVKNTGIAQREGALKQLDNLSQRNLAERYLNTKNRSSMPAAYDSSIGLELRQQLGDTPASSSLVDRENAERVVRLAQKKGHDPQEAMKLYDEVTDTIIANDVALGYHNSMYAPIKDAFMQEVTQRGGDFEQGQQIWQAMTSAAMRGENAMDIGLTADLRVARSHAPFDRAGEEILNADPNDANALLKPTFSTNDLMDRISRGLALDFNSYFKGISQGHFRNTYAAHQARKDPEKLIKALSKGEVVRTPVMTSRVYEGGMKAAGFEAESKLIGEYMTNIAPGRRGERSLLVRQANLAQHLADNGVPKARVNEAMAKLMAEVAPDNLRDAVDGTWRTLNYQRQVAGQTNLGYGLASQRTRTDVPTATSFIPKTEEVVPGVNPPVKTNGVTELQDLGFNQTEADEILGAYETDRSMLGQLYDPMVSLGEAADYLKRHYPVRQFTLDTYTMANREGYVKKLEGKAGTTDIPDGWVAVPEGKEEFGPFAGTVMHGHLYREVKNGLMSDAEGRLSMLGRFQSNVTGGFLASPKSIANNFVGGIYSSHLYGSNPVELINEWQGVIGDIGRLGEKGKLGDFEDIGHLLGSQTKALQFAKGIDSRKLDLSGMGKQGWKERVEDVFKNQLERPGGQGWAGLDGFQGVEDTLKLANYRLALKKYGSHPEGKEKALEFARNALFDYAALPESARILRDKGLLTFPGFPLFMTSRTIGTAVKNPGRLMPYDRMAGAAWEGLTDSDEERYAAAAGMADYQIDNRSVPISKREGDGGAIFKMFPLFSWMPTNILDKDNLMSPVNENLASFGIARPLVDAALAWTSLEGEAAMSSRYGAKVFDPGKSAPVRAVQTGAFVGQQIMPALLKNVVSYNPGRTNPSDGLAQRSAISGTGVGLVKAAVQPLAEGTRKVVDYYNIEQEAPDLYRWMNRNMMPLDEATVSTFREAQEGMRNKVERSHADEFAGIFVSTPSPLSLEPQTNTAMRKAPGYETDRANKIDEWEKKQNWEMQKIAEGRGDTDNLVRLVEAAQAEGKEELTLANGQTIKVYPEMLDTLAQVEYWRTRNQR